jgi:hypothetical protein
VINLEGDTREIFCASLPSMNAEGLVLDVWGELVEALEDFGLGHSFVGY